MAAVLLRVALLAAGLGTTEIGLGSGLWAGPLTGWALVLVVGLPLIVAGTAGFMVPLLAGKPHAGRPSDA